jgi:cell division protein FtsW
MRHVSILIGCIVFFYFVSTLVLFSIGVVQEDDLSLHIPKIFLKQLIIIVIALFSFYLIQSIDIKRMGEISWIALLLSLLSIVLLYIPGVGEVVGNNRSWIVIASGFRLEPVELFKGALVLWFAHTCSTIGRTNKKLFLFYLILLFVVVTPIIFGLKDFGNLALVVVIFMALLYISPLSPRLLLIYLPVVLSLFFYILHSRISRLKNFMSNDSSKNYQTLQSIKSIANGGVIGGGDISYVKHLPEASTDYIFSVILNRFGLIGFLVVMFVFLVLVITMLGMAFNTTNLFAHFLILSTLLWILINSLCNILVCFGMIPVLGVPFIFLSYGGSYNIVILCLISLIIKLYNEKNPLEAGKS